LGVTVYKKRGLLSKKVIALFFYKRSGYSLQVLAKLRFTSLSCGLSTAIPNAGGVSSTLLFYNGETSPFVTLYIGVKCVLRIYISTPIYIMIAPVFHPKARYSRSEASGSGEKVKKFRFQKSRLQRVKV
jgi:hypothetical protein